MIYYGENNPTIYYGDNEAVIYYGEELIYPLTVTKLSVTPKNIIRYHKNGNTYIIRVAAPSTWVATCDADWVTLSQTTGAAGERYVINVTISTWETDEEGIQRDAIITFSTAEETFELPITQFACEPFEITTDKYYIPDGTEYLDNCHFTWSKEDYKSLYGSWLNEYGNNIIEPKSKMINIYNAWPTLKGVDLDIKGIINFTSVLGLRNYEVGTTADNLEYITLTNCGDLKVWTRFDGGTNGFPEMHSCWFDDLSNIDTLFYDAYSFPWGNKLNVNLVDAYVKALPKLSFSMLAPNLSTQSIENIINALPQKESGDPTLTLTVNASMVNLTQAHRDAITAKGWTIKNG